MHAQAGPTTLTETLDPIPHILCAGSLNLLAGASGIGKTALLSWLLRQFETGADIFNHPINTPSAIAYLSADRSWRRNGHWFRASGVESLITYSLVDAKTTKLPNQRMKHLRVEFFKGLVAQMQLPPGALLVVDPVALFLGGNLLDYDTVGFACIEIQRWLQDPSTNYCIIGICHSSKQKADKGDRYLRLQDRISGTMAQLGYTDTQMFLAGPEETGDKDGRYTFLWNPHTAPAETFQFKKGPQGLFLTGHAALVTPQGEAVNLQITEDQQLLLAGFPAPGEVLATHALLIQYADADPTKRRRLFEQLRMLEQMGHVVQVKRGLWSRLK